MGNDDFNFDDDLSFDDDFDFDDDSDLTFGDDDFGDLDFGPDDDLDFAETTAIAEDEGRSSAFVIGLVVMSLFFLTGLGLLLFLIFGDAGGPSEAQLTSTAVVELNMTTEANINATSTQVQVYANLTSTAEQWTPTPSATFTPSPTNTPTPSPTSTDAPTQDPSIALTPTNTLVPTVAGNAVEMTATALANLFNQSSVIQDVPENADINSSGAPIFITTEPNTYIFADRDSGSPFDTASGRPPVVITVLPDVYVLADPDTGEIIGNGATILERFGSALTPTITPTATATPVISSSNNIGKSNLNVASNGFSSSSSESQVASKRFSSDAGGGISQTGDDLIVQPRIPILVTSTPDVFIFIDPDSGSGFGDDNPPPVLVEIEPDVYVLADPTTGEILGGGALLVQGAVPPGSQPPVAATPVPTQGVVAPILVTTTPDVFVLIDPSTGQIIGGGADAPPPTGPSVGQGGGAVPTSLPNAGIFDDIAGGVGFGAIFMMAFGLVGVIFFSRKLRGLNNKRK